MNDDGSLIDTRALNYFIHFDIETGILEVEAGVLLGDILKVVVPKGWMLPVTPGTKFVTVGGAIANDVHGKNHHLAGSFGCHVKSMCLHQSALGKTLCSPEDNSELFYATIGGLGLTGIICSATLQLRPINSSWLDSQDVRYKGLSDFFSLAEESEQDFEYTVAWLDCSARGSKLGQGIFSRANHSTQGDLSTHKKPRLTVPFSPPVSLINRLSIPTFNAIYLRKATATWRSSQSHYASFYYPLDGIYNWNRIYGRRGFYQFQCLIPKAEAEQATKILLEQIQFERSGSFLVVLKNLGDRTSGGLLSFCKPGTTLAIDFPNLGAKTLRLMKQLEKTVYDAGGHLYPAKDALMSPNMFLRLAGDRLSEFQQLRDPALSSSFIRRVTAS